MVMLCKATKIPITNDNKFVWEIKYDGDRAVINKTGNKINIYNRRGNEVTERFPELVEDLQKINSDFTLDGEIVVFKNGRSDFSLVAKRTHLQKQDKIRLMSQLLPVNFVVFDALRIDNEDLKDKPYDVRYYLIEQFFKTQQFANKLVRSEHYKLSEFDEQALRHKRLEGVIFKRLTSTYENRRSKEWLKYKFVEEKDMKILQLEKNNAGYKCYCENNVKVQCSGRQSQALRIGMTITVEYLEETASGALRMPTFKKIVR